jgi:methionine synthase I (cobalamin-dependent)
MASALPRSGRSFLDALSRRGAIIADGAMGTALHDLGIPFDVSYEELVLSRPDVIARIHEDFVRAGAQVIETDTFGANRVRLDRHGLGERVREINLAAVALARRVAGGRAWVAGAIGPTGLAVAGLTEGERDRVREAFREQAAALAEGGADVLLLETLGSAREVELALEGVRAASGHELPVIAQVSVGEERPAMADGMPVASMGFRMRALGCDVIGVNCAGEKGILAAIQALLPLGVPLSAMPSAGLPRREGERFVYPCTPERFGVLARRLCDLGVKLVGGCCGTTPEHVRRIAAAVSRAGEPVAPALSLRWSRSVPSLREPSLRVAYLRAELSSRPLVEVARALDALSGAAEQADPIAREVLGAVVTVLADPGAADLADALRKLSEHEALLALGRLVRRRTRGEHAPDRPVVDERTLATSSSGRVLTLGERRALARRPSRAALDKLLSDPHPMVVKNLLQNPRLTEDDVVRMAARRPAFPDVIGEVARHPMWSQRARVRMAIVQNPGAPAELAVPLVRLLIRPELHQVVSAPDVPAVVRAAARELLDRRPPVPEKRESDETQ